MESAAPPVRKGPKKGTKYKQRDTPVLVDMRWAYKHSHDGSQGTPQQEHFRRLLLEKPGEFVTLLERMERIKQAPAKPASGQAVSGGSGAEPDAGGERAVALLERWLQEWNHVDGQGVVTPGAADGRAEPPAGDPG